MSDTPQIDMSPEAIEGRLRTLAALYDLGISLREARFVGRVEEVRETAKNAADFDVPPQASDPRAPTRD